MNDVEYGIAFFLALVLAFVAFLGGMTIQENISERQAIAHGAAQFVQSKQNSERVVFTWNDEIKESAKK